MSNANSVVMTMALYMPRYWQLPPNTNTMRGVEFVNPVKRPKR